MVAGQNQRRQLVGGRAKDVYFTDDLCDLIYPIALARRASRQDQEVLAGFLRLATDIAPALDPAMGRLLERVEVLAYGLRTDAAKLPRARDSIMASASPSDRLATLLRALVGTWLDYPVSRQERAALVEIEEAAIAGGYRWVAAQAADLLGAAGDERRAAGRLDVDELLALLRDGLMT